MAAAKVCVVCGIDVSTIKRVKDPQGNYYCQVCYDAKLAGKRARASGDPETDFQCATCQRFYGVEDVYDEGGKTICKACFAVRARPALAGQFTPKPTPPSPTAAAPSPGDPDVLELVDEPAEPAAAHRAAPPSGVSENLDVLEEVTDETPGTAVLWHVHDKGQSHGPFPPDQLVQAIRQGRFSTAASVWKDGMADWQPILRIEHLLGHAI